MGWLKQQAWKRFLLSFLMVGLAWQLAGCGDKEPQQRKAFIEFLQTRVLPSDKLTLPTLTEKEKDAIGKYSDDYAILTDFSKEMTNAFSGSNATMAKMRGLVGAKDMVDNRDEVVKTRAEVASIEQKRAETMKKIQQRYADLKQPDDLKVVFNQAYEKSVTKPNALMQQSLALTNDILGQVIDLADYLKSLGNKVQYVGPAAQFTDQSQLDTFNHKITAMRAKQQELLNIARQLMSMQ